MHGTAGGRTACTRLSSTSLGSGGGGGGVSGGRGVMWGACGGAN